jgi:hypothetical protein
MHSLHRRIRNPQASSDDGEAGEVAAWCLWCLCIGSRSDGGGSLSLPPLFCEIMGFFIRIPHGDGDKVFWSSVVRQLAVADGSSSPVLIKMVVDVRSMLMMRLRVGAGREILLHFQCLTPLMKDGGGLGDSPVSSGELEKDVDIGVAFCNFQV